MFYLHKCNLYFRYLAAKSGEQICVKSKMLKENIKVCANRRIPIYFNT